MASGALCCAASSTSALHRCRLWKGSGAMSVAGFLHPTAEGKPDHLGIKSLEQDAQESFSERRGIPCRRPSGALCRYPSQASSQGTAAPQSICSHHKQGSKLPAVRMPCGERTADKQHTGARGLQDQLATRASMLMFISFSQKLELLSFCLVLWSGRGQGHWRICCLI